LLWGVIIIAALLAFEIFNYSTTDYALGDLLGDLSFLGIRWATILAIAFCGIDFAGIARLFTPEDGNNQQQEVWYLFGAWLLAATMNAMLTWWGVSLAVLHHQTLGNSVVGQDVLVRVVPIFVAVLVWLIRVLIIGTFSVAGDRLFSQAEIRTITSQRVPQAMPPQPAASRTLNGAFGTAARQASVTATSGQRTNHRPAPLPEPAPSRIEPVYQNTPASAAPKAGTSSRSFSPDTSSQPASSRRKNGDGSTTPPPRRLR
jgi:hypothetical protein